MTIRMSDATGDSTPWQIEPPKRAAALAYDRLRRAIIGGEFQPGERLTETAVAQRLG